MNDQLATPAWIKALDHLIGWIERPMVRFKNCQTLPEPRMVGVGMAIVVTTQVALPLIDRLGALVGGLIGVGYGVLAGTVAGGILLWSDGWSERWGVKTGPGRRPFPGMGGLAVLLMLTSFLAALPLLWLLPHPRAVGAVWGVLLYAYACLLFVFQRMSRNQMLLLASARDMALRSRLAPHFLFNTLNSLKAQVDKDPADAARNIDRLAGLYRQVVETSDRLTVPLREELAFVEGYLGIERTRMGDRLQVAIDVPEELEDLPVPPFSLQVLVENAVKHGLAPLEAGGRIAITARRAGAELILAVEDDGTGPGATPAGTGTALDTLRQRLARPEDLEMGMAGGRHRVAFRWRA